MKLSVMARSAISDSIVDFRQMSADFNVGDYKTTVSIARHTADPRLVQIWGINKCPWNARGLDELIALLTNIRNELERVS